MTPPASPRDDQPGVEQEGIWEEPHDASPDADGGEGDHQRVGQAARSSRELTSSITSTDRVPGPAGLYLADVPNRIIALILDIIVLSVAGFVLAWFLGGLVTQPGAFDAAGGGLDVVAFVVVLLLQFAVSLAYFVGSWVWLTSTPGMRLLGLRIGDVSEGGSITLRQGLVRWLLLGVPSVLASLPVYVPDAVGVLLGVIGIAWLLLLLYTIAQSPTRQGLHDRVARTIVTRLRRRTG